MFEKVSTDKLFVEVIDSKGMFYISRFGLVFDKDINKLTTSKDSQGYPTARVHSWDGLKDYRICDLIALHFKRILIPKESFGFVEGFNIDSNLENNEASNVGYRFKEPIESKKHKGHFYVPGFNQLVINREGVALFENTGATLKYYVLNGDKKKNTKGGYMVGSAACINGIAAPASRHRMLCMTFMPYGNDIDRLVTNHIDGVPGNDDINNLEIVTRRANNIHAYQNNLKSQQMAVLCRNVKTMEVTEYYSVAECGRALGMKCDEGSITYRLRTAFCTIFDGKYQFKYKSDTRDWLAVEDSPIAVAASIRVCVRNCKTLEVIVYDTVTEAAKATDNKEGTVFYRVKHSVKKPLRGYQFQKDSKEELVWPDFTQQELEDSYKENSLSISARNLLTGKTAEYASAREASRIHNSREVMSSLREHGNYLLPTGWQFKYLEDEWVEYDDPAKAVYLANKTISAKCEETGKVFVSLSSRKMAEVLGMDPKQLRKAAITKGTKVYRGYRLRLGISNDPWPTE